MQMVNKAPIQKEVDNVQHEFTVFCAMASLMICDCHRQELLKKEGVFI